MDFYLDTTPLPTQQAFYTSNASSGSMPPSRVRQFGATRFLAITPLHETDLRLKAPSDLSILQNNSRELDTTAIPPGLNESKDGRDNVIPRFTGNSKSAVSDTSKIAEDRIKLLAAKYANDSISSEIMARLEILNTRLAVHAPRVTSEQIESLEVSIGKIKSIEASRTERAKRLGLKP
ncbi:hypothetical protein [Pseudomonas coronafaciens]|uniref:hypothetical protein n=1 Tax=Pseudomonas coronafaciens TaxID=53409 RepID=UPI0011C3EC71|nr:hypothetical protein [Pseudomonas coronafaciens]